MDRTIRDGSLLTLAFLLSVTAAFAQKEVSIGAPRPGSPKTVTFRIVVEDQSLRLDRLIESTMVLEKDGTKLVSTPIKEEESQGVCTIREVPPGEYKLIWKILHLSAKMKIRERATSEVSFEFRFVKGGVQIKELAP
jgi:hypothetical protein